MQFIWIVVLGVLLFVVYTVIDRRRELLYINYKIESTKHLLHLYPLEKIEKTGEGFTRLPQEVQLVSGERLSILYTKSSDENQSEIVETVHIKVANSGFLAITRINDIVTVLGGDTHNFRYPNLTHQTRVSIAKIFKTVSEAI